MRMLGQEALSELLRPLGQRLVGVALALPSREPGHHLVDPLALLGSGELSRDENDDTFAVPICGHGAPPPRAAPDLNEGLTYARGEAPRFWPRREVTHVGKVARCALVPARANLSIKVRAR